MIRKNEKEIPRLKTAANGLPCLYFPALEETGLVRHAFTTRAGGVSKGVYAALNLSFSREGDPRENVLENYRRVAEAMGVELESFVLTYQTHTTAVRQVGKEDRGKGVLRERDYRDVDGLITNEPGITLGTFFADCIPLYFLDPKTKSIGLAHSGWRGTAGQMGAAILKAMEEAYGTRAGDVLAAIGPGICRDCYQVSEEVYEAFSRCFASGEMEMIFTPDTPGHYLLDLWLANVLVLKNAGVREENISCSNICTAENTDMLYSHRKMGENRGNMAAFLALR